MNPRIPADYHELGGWLQRFAVSHAKRESPQVEAIVETAGEREGRALGLRLSLGAGAWRDAVRSELGELSVAEVAEGRTRFAWCEALAQRIRGEARRLIAQRDGGQSRSA